MIITNKQFLVIGTALSGIASAKALVSKGAYVTLTDVKPRETLDKEVWALEKHPNLKGIFGVHPPASLLDTTDYIVMSPGVPMGIPIIKMAQKMDIEILSEIELAYRLGNTPIIAITGTNGKTTTTSLVGEIFKASGKGNFVVGNIGTPMISLIDKASKNDWFIAEISSFQLEGIKYFKPFISAILNITPDHLNRHRTMENYVHEKSKIFSNQQCQDITILNADDPIAFSLQNQAKGKVILFSRSSILEEGVFVENNQIIIREQKENKIVCSVSDLQMPGDHNLENALAATAISYYGKVSIKDIRNVLKIFKGVSHRMELVDTIDEVIFINDSKGTNPEASIKAIEAIEKPIVLIAGGMDKGSDFTQFIKSFNGKVRHLILLGETADIIEQSARVQNFYNITKVENMQSAIKNSFEIANKGDVVLLSPACASWDMFNNFEERGNLFKDMVRSLRRS